MVTESKPETVGSDQERRRFGRFATRLPIATCRDSLAKQGRSQRLAFCRLQIHDFSLGGLKAACTVPLKVNEPLTLRLPPVGLRPQAELTGRVVHCHRQDNRYEVGIEFCQTHKDVAASPWLRLSSLFSLAAQFPTERAAAFKDA
jgi:hypothetical protein